MKPGLFAALLVLWFAGLTQAAPPIWTLQRTLQIPDWGNGPIALSQQGRQIASWKGRLLQIHDIASGQVVGQWWWSDVEQHVGPTVFTRRGRVAFSGTAFAISPNGQQVAWTGRFPLLYDAKSNQVQTNASTIPTGIVPIGIAAYEGLVPMGLAVYDLRSHALVWQVHSVPLPGDWDSALCLAFSPDGKWLAMGTQGGGLKIWNAATGMLLRTLRGPADPHGTQAARAGLLAQPGRTVAVVFSPDGRTLLTGGGDGLVRLWNPQTGALLRTLITPGVQSLAFSPQGQTLIAASRRTILIWPWPCLSRPRVLRGHDEPLFNAVASPEGRTLWSSAEDGTIKHWDMRSGKTIATYGHIQQATIDDRGNLLAYSLGDSDVVLQDLHTGKTRRILHGFYHPQRAFSFSDVSKILDLSPDGRMLAGGAYTTEGFVDHSGVFHSRAFVWDTRTGHLRHQWEEDPGATLDFSPRGHRLVMMTALLTDTPPLIRVRALPSGRLLRDWNPDAASRPPFLGQPPINLNGASPSFLPSGRLVLAAPGARTPQTTGLGIWDVMSGRRLRWLPGEDNLESANISDDGHSVIGVAPQGKQVRLRVWSLPAGNVRGSWSLPGFPDATPALSDDGTWAAIGEGEDGWNVGGSLTPICVLNTHMPGAVTKLTGFAGGLLWLSFSADNRRLFAVSRNGALNEWTRR